MVALTLALLTQGFAQQPTTAQDEEEVVRITSNLIQIDAVVLDSEGRQVTDLTADDFELSEDGRPQAITNLSYVDNSSEPKAVAAKSAAPAKQTQGSAPVPPARVRAGGARRIIAFVVDDLGLSFQATAYVRNFLKDFVKDQMRPGDLVAIVRTSAGVGALQQFTGDPRLVGRAIEGVRFQPGFRAPTGPFAAAAERLKGGTKDSAKDDDEKGEGAPDRDALFTVGTLGALNYVLRGAAEMPGRKSGQQVGSANELIEVPDLAGGRLALSGIVLSGRSRDITTLAAVPPAGGDLPASEAELEAEPAVRRLRAGVELRYDFHIYNAQLDPAPGRPQLQTQVRLFREGQLAYEGQLAPFETTQREDLKRLVAGGSVKLNRAAPPGDYTLQLVGTDLLAREGRRTATQWLDFRIVR